MSTVVVRCGVCRQLSRVAAEAVGLEVACPRCPATFVARPEPDAAEPPLVRRADPGRVPVVRPRTELPRPIVWEAPEPVAPVVERVPPSGGLIALALLPFGIPLLWLLASAVTQREVVMSFAVPVAVAVCASGLALGTATVDRWSVGTRVKAVVALLFLAYLVAGLLFIVSKEWLEDLRRVFNRGDIGWREFRAPETDKHIGYSVKFPGRPVVEGDSPVPEWDWQAFQHTDGAKPGADVYLSAVGPVPPDVAKAWAADKVWFEGVGKVVRASAKGFADETESREVTAGDLKGREYHFTGDGRNRVVRIYRARGQAVYLAVEGAFVTPDAVDVQYFLNSLRVPFK